MRDRWALDGRLALITGGTKGIGRAIADEIIQLGGVPYIVARNAEEVNSIIESYRTKGFMCDGISADITLENDRIKIIDDIHNRFGKLDILINNVGINIRKKAVEYSYEEYNKVITTNMNAVFALTVKTHDLLKKSGDGAVVNITSVAGLTHLKTGAPYGMTKAALQQLTRNLAAEWAEDNIRVNSIAPWYTKTALVKHLLKDEEYKESILDRTPMKRIAEPVEIAGAAVFLCMPAASYITGQCLAVDGGFSIYGF